MTDRNLRRPRRSALGIIATLGLLGAVVAVLPATAAGAKVTRGEFNAFSANTRLDIGGDAVMVRTADGRTIVTVMSPGSTQVSHTGPTSTSRRAASAWPEGTTSSSRRPRS